MKYDHAVTGNQAIEHADEKSQERLAIIMAAIAGFVDAFGLMQLKTYVSFMSGNTTQAGLSLAEDKGSIAITALMAISGFVAGIFSGTWLGTYKWYKPMLMPFLFTALLLCIIMCLLLKAHADKVCIIGMLSVTMGFMNTIMKQVGKQQVNTDFVTGTLNSMSQHLALGIKQGKGAVRRSHLLTAGRLFLMWLGFFSGAWMFVFANACVGIWSLGFPVVLLLGIPFYHSVINLKS